MGSRRDGLGQLLRDASFRVSGGFRGCWGYPWAYVETAVELPKVGPTRSPSSALLPFLREGSHTIN